MFQPVDALRIQVSWVHSPLMHVQRIAGWGHSEPWVSRIRMATRGTRTTWRFPRCSERRCEWDSEVELGIATQTKRQDGPNLLASL